MLRVNGGTIHMTMNKTQPFCSLGLYINQKNYKRFIRGNCTGEFTIKIPASDTVKGGEYHGLRINNTGEFVDGWPVHSKDPVMVYRDTLLIDSIPVGQEKIVNRAFGPLELKTRFGGNAPTFGVEAEFLQKAHPKIKTTDLRSRLTLYQQLWKIKQVMGDLSVNSASSFDARTERLLISEQLLESAIPQVVKGELRVAMQALAEENEFTAQFSNLIYSEILGSDVLDAIEPFLLNADPTIRRQAQVLHEALNRRTTAWTILDDVNIKNFSSKVLRVQNLLYELGQFYSKEDFLQQLSFVASDLNQADREQFFRIAKKGRQIWTVQADDLEGKGTVLNAFLQF
jgi:hypothetical protein